MLEQYAQEDFAGESLDDLLMNPPRQTEAEQALLCLLLREPLAMGRVVHILKPEHFYSVHHQAIYSACLNSYHRQTPGDTFFLSVVFGLDEQGQDDLKGYVNDLLISDPTGYSVTQNAMEYLIDILLDMAKRRALAAACYDWMRQSNDKSDVSYLETAQNALMDIQQAYSLPERETMGKMADEALVLIEAKLDAPNGLTGLSTGFPTLDAKTHGFQKENLIALGARPSIGKTTFGLAVTSHVVLKEQKPVLFFSLEMSGKEVLEKIIKCQAGSTFDRQKLHDATRLIKAHQHLFHIQDKTDISLSDIRAMTHKTLTKQPDLGLVVVDHLALVKSGEAKRFQNRTYELEEITWGLKAMAKTLKIPVLLLCQLNRASEGRQDKTLLLSDLRDSGSIEQNADIVMFLGGEREEPKRTLQIAKQRNGPLAQLRLGFNGAISKLWEVII